MQSATGFADICAQARLESGVYIFVFETDLPFTGIE
jgi:hypothetical protein